MQAGLRRDCWKFQARCVKQTMLADQFNRLTYTEVLVKYVSTFKVQVCTSSTHHHIMTRTDPYHIEPLPQISCCFKCYINVCKLTDSIVYHIIFNSHVNMYKLTWSNLQACCSSCMVRLCRVDYCMANEESLPNFPSPKSFKCAYIMRRLDWNRGHTLLRHKTKCMRVDQVCMQQSDQGSVFSPNQPDATRPNYRSIHTTITEARCSYRGTDSRDTSWATWGCYLCIYIYT
jgi:hypothetical protein